MFECSVIEATTDLREQEEYQREYRNEEERQMKESQDILLEAERHLHDPGFIRAHTDRQLRALSKVIEARKRALWEKYHAKFGNDHFFAFLETDPTRMYVRARSVGDTKTGASTLGKPSPCP